MTGPRGSGKTSLALEVFRLAGVAGLSAGGLVTVGGRRPDGRPSGLSTLDLRSGESRPLAWRPEGAPEAALVFSAEAFAWGIGRFLDAAGLSPSLLILDEIGPLELHGRGGWAPLLPRLSQLAAWSRATVLLTTRQGLEEELETLLGTSTAELTRLSAPASPGIPPEIDGTARMIAAGLPRGPV